MSNWNSWAITTDERIKHDAQFQFLKPINGYLTGEQAREFFLKSGLPPLVLGQIWSLSDLDADGKLDKKEFSIAMYLIKKKIEGMQLPSTLPAGLRDDPQLVLTSSSSLVTKSPSPASGTINVNGVSKSPPSAPADRSAANSPDFRNWTSSALSRPKYRLLFNQHDRAKRGYLTGVESRGIFLQSGLSQQILAHIWSLADLDKDGNLDCEEFCIASFLIERALAGAQLPQTLPPDLLPSVSRASGQTSSLNNPPANIQSDDENKAPPLSFEDKRRENFRQGQVELDRRKQELAEKLRQEEDARLEKERQERKRFEQICMEKERQKAIEAERHTERLRELEVQREARRRQAMEARTQAWRAAEAQRQKESERQRVEALKREKSQAQTLLEQTIAHRASLLESASSQEQRRRELDVQLMTASARVDAHKSAINEMRGRRDTYERDIRDLTEQVEAAKAELTRWQREREQLNLRISTGVDTNQTTELCKTLTMNRELRQSKINQLKSQLRELDENMTRKGQELASRRNTVAELDRRSSKLQLELLDLRKTLEKKYLAHKGIENPSHKESSPVDTLEAGREQYEVMFDFTARHPDELSLTVGTVVDVYVNPPVKVAAEWLYGEVNGNKGLFPESYVRKRVTGKIDPFDPFGVHKANANVSGPSPSKDSAPATVSQPCSGEPSGTGTPGRANFADPLFSCIALYPFESTVVGDLNLAVNDVVHVYTVRDEWWEGVCVRTKQSGLFPANYMRKLTPEEARSVTGHSAEPKSTDTTNQVAWPNPLPTEPLANVVASSEVEVASSSPVDQPPSISNPTTSVTTATKPEFARVIAPYTATAPGQLSLQPGQVVQLRKRSNKGWWEGELQQRGRVRQYGWFPADYVKLITPSTANGSINDAD
ncbi:hypothetical protein EG68_06277 [Paragonimus skrjabini miyazakii]|uniref:Intersectin-1 n=1 Tax=Paragonimus skrjabini miyazakii TaxID=59628 RepID=A0A8S9YS83_9TREM|nr:hypothetical protein EG68_06277 [Paragonimus skrjabini miyazakii]